MPNPPPGGELVLIRSLSKSTWLATVGSAPATARSWVPTPDVGDPDPAALAAVEGLNSPLLARHLGVTDFGGTRWLLSERVVGVSVRRLLTLASLTPGQAASIAARVLEAVALLHGAGLAHGRLHTGNVLITDDGQTMLTDWTLWALAPSGPFEDVRDADCNALRGIIAALARCADRPVAFKNERDQLLLARMQSIAATYAVNEPGSASEALDRAVASATERDGRTLPLQAELAALVATLNRTPHSDPAPPVAQHHHATSPHPVTPHPVPQAFPKGPLSTTDWQRRRFSRSRLLAIAAAVVVLLGAGVLAVRGPVGTLLDKVTGSSDSAKKPQAAAKPLVAAAPKKAVAKKPTLRPVGNLAPSSGGFVTGMALRPLNPCRPGRSCDITATIRLAPLSGVTSMNWSFVVVNRCNGARTTVPGGSMVAQPGWPYVYDTRTVQLPAGRAFAIVGMTTEPVKVASRPLLTPSGGGTC